MVVYTQIAAAQFHNKSTALKKTNSHCCTCVSDSGIGAHHELEDILRQLEKDF